MSKKHARFSPSQLDNLSLCLRFKYKEMEDAANEGTDLHAAIENDSDVGLDEEQKLQVTKIQGYVGSLAASIPDAIVQRERRLELKELTWGTGDIIIMSPNRRVGHVVDAKFIRVSSEHSFQVRTYAAALLEETPEMEQVSTHIVAPRLEQIDTETYDRSLLPKVRAEIEALYARIEDPFLPPTPHSDLCGKCARAGRCPALVPAIRESAARLTLPVPSAFAPDAMVSTKDRAIAQVLAGVFENWAEQVKRANAAFVAAGGEVPGFKLVTRSTGFRISSEATAAAFATLEAAGIPREMLLNAMTLSISKLAKERASVLGEKEGDVKEELTQHVLPFGSAGTCQFLQKARKIDDATMVKQLTGVNDV